MKRFAREKPHIRRINGTWFVLPDDLFWPTPWYYYAEMWCAKANGYCV